MKKHTKHSLLKLVVVIVVGIGVSSCAKWFDKNLDDSKVALLSPPNNHSDSILSKTFWWDEAEGVREYQLQIVSPTFDSIVRFVEDTIVGATSFEKTLIAGEYQWRVRPVNDSYKGIWTKRSFTINSTNNLAGQSIIGLLPSNGFATKNLEIEFSWSALSNASNYIFIIKDKNSSIIYSTVVASNSTSYTFTKDGSYTWSVQGQNDISASVSSSSLVQIDNTDPLLPNLLTVVNDTIKSFPANFTWSEAVADDGSAVTDSLIFSTQSDFSTIEKFGIVTGKSSFELDTLVNKGTYYWRIGRVDAVGNYGGRTASKTFVVE